MGDGAAPGRGDPTARPGGEPGVRRSVSKRPLEQARPPAKMLCGSCLEGAGLAVGRREGQSGTEA